MSGGCRFGFSPLYQSNRLTSTNLSWNLSQPAVALRETEASAGLARSYEGPRPQSREGKPGRVRAWRGRGRMKCCTGADEKRNAFGHSEPLNRGGWRAAQTIAISQPGAAKNAGGVDCPHRRFCLSVRADVRQVRAAAIRAFRKVLEQEVARRGRPAGDAAFPADYRFSALVRLPPRMRRFDSSGRSNPVR